MLEDEGASPHERAADKEDEDDNYMPPSEHPHKEGGVAVELEVESASLA